MEDTRDDEILAELSADHARREAEAEGTAAAPEPEELLDLLHDRLPPAEARRLERRLLADPEAVRSLLDLADFAEAEAAADARAAGEGTPRDVATHAGWRDFERRLSTERGAPRRSPSPPRWLVAVAAGLFVATLGLGGWVWKLSTPEPTGIASLPTLQLVAVRSGEEPTVPLPPGAPLRLALAPSERCPSYRATVRRADGWERSVDLAPAASGALSLLLEQAPPGSYTVQLTGCDPPREIETHRFRVVSGEGGDAG